MARSEGLTALLIEHDSRIVRIVRTELQRAGWTLIWHDHGGDAARVFAQSHVDAIILGLMFPDVDSLTLCACLRASVQAPILILAGQDTIADRVKALDAGADDILGKPFSARELVARLHALTRRWIGDPTVEDWIVVGTLRLSDRRHEVQVSGEKLALTTREYNMLRYFVANAGRVLTRTMIRDWVWGWGFTGSATLVDVHVGNLRRKLEAFSGAPHIRTVRGAGYRLDPRK